jgi:arylsulfatase A-like enzyme
VSPARRVPFLLFLGFAAGWAVGALETAAIRATTELAFPDPLGDSVQVAWRYALVGAVLALALGFLPRKLRPNRAASVLATTLAVMVFVSGTSWIHQKSFPGVPAWSLGPLVANGVLAAFCLVAGYGIGRLRASFAAVLVLAVAGHGGAMIAGGTEPATTEAPAPAPEGAPNILFLLVDTLRADHLQSYGYEKQTSPVLDRIAAEGLRFHAAYAQATWTRPSVASLMTSLYPASHLTNSTEIRVPEELPTLAEVVRAQGYATAGFSANRNVSEIFGFHQGFDVFWTHASDELNSMLRFTTWERVMEILRGLGLVGHKSPANQAEHITDRVLRWVEEHDGSPYFLYIQYIDPHGPYDPPAHYLEEVGIEPLDRDLAAKMNVTHGADPFPFFEVEGVDEASLARVRELYDAEIAYCDREIGRLLDAMRERGLLDNTYIVVTSDHGEEFWEHKQFGHGQSAYDELARVPLLVDGPGIEPGVVPGAVELIDLYPTIATWVGAPLPPRIQGRDLNDLIAGGAREEAAEALVSNMKGFELTAWVFGREKLVRIELRGEEAWMLYDLDADPLEQNDLAAARPERLAELKALLLERRQRAAEYRVDGVETTTMDRDLAREMEGLGYVDEGEDDE